MTRPFDSTDIKRITSEYLFLEQKLKEICSSSDQHRKSIQKALETLITKEVLKVLRDVPVEELNHEKIGIRVKLLRENGYQTVADIATTSIYAISSIYGISKEAAHTIKQISNDIVSKTRKEVKIRISSDDKTPEISRLVCMIGKYMRCKVISDAGRNLLPIKRQAHYSIEDLKIAHNSIKWFFASSSAKQKAIDAFNYLTTLKDGAYGKDIEKYSAELVSINKLLPDESWELFSSNSIDFFNILEEISPGVLGNDDSLYGLPEDIAREIQEECLFPDGLLCTLRRYQEWGVKYALHQERILLGDEMGLGKTVQAIATMVSLRNTGGTHFIVICPASVITNWCREIRKMSRLNVTKVHGTGRKAAIQAWICSGGVAVTTYETTAYFSLPDDFKFTMLIVDEAHYIKNPDAKRTINVKNIGQHTNRMMFMTGTALENKVDEMISLIEILQPNVANNIKGMAFMAAAPQFRTAVAPVYYRRKREDVLTELPELIESKEWCSLGKQEEDAYEQAVLSRNYSESRRVSWNIDNLNFSSKANRLLELVKEAESEGRKVIVFSFFLDTIRKITELLEGRCIGPINGSVSPQKRQEIIDAFDNSPAGTVLAAQIQSGGTGLNIQSASVVILCEPQFKPSIENQAISRAYRMGQTRNVLVYRLLCENTVDEKISSILEEKQAIFDAFADKSAAAQDNLELDSKTFGDIIKEEIDRINAKNGISQKNDDS